MNLMNLIPIAMTLNHLDNLYSHCTWEPPESWKANQIDPNENIKNLIKEAGIQEDLRFYSRDLGSNNSASAFGGYSFFKSKLAIVTHTDIDINDLAMNFVLRHELTHIKNNDFVLRPTFVAVVSAAHLVFGLIYMNAAFTTLAVYLSAKTSFFYYSRFMERRADQYAIDHSTIEELNIVLISFNQSLARNQVLHAQSVEGKISYSPEGNSNTDWEHDPLTTRIKQIEAAIQLKTQKAISKQAVVPIANVIKAIPRTPKALCATRKVKKI